MERLVDNRLPRKQLCPFASENREKCCDQLLIVWVFVCLKTDNCPPFASKRSDLIRMKYASRKGTVFYYPAFHFDNENLRAVYQCRYCRTCCHPLWDLILGENVIAPAASAPPEMIKEGSVSEWLGRPTWNQALLWPSAGFVRNSLWLNSSAVFLHSRRKSLPPEILNLLWTRFQNFPSLISAWITRCIVFHISFF